MQKKTFDQLPAGAADGAESLCSGHGSRNTSNSRFNLVC